MSVEALKEAWKDFSLDGAEMIFHYGPSPVKEDGVWVEETVGSVGWKARSGINQYGSFVLISEPVFHEVAAEHLKETYAEFRRLHPV